MSLIQLMHVNTQERLNFAGIINNEISDHQVIAIDMNLALPPQKVNYITVYSNNNRSKLNFKNDFEVKRVYDRLNQELDANPYENYYILETAITDSMNAHLEKKIVKFNRRKHKKDPWITYGILNSVNHKNRLYKRLMKLNRDTQLFITKKQEFNAYFQNLRRMLYKLMIINYSKIKRKWPTHLIPTFPPYVQLVKSTILIMSHHMIIPLIQK